MLDRLKAMFDSWDRGEDRGRPHREDELQFAAAALMMEAARMDDAIGQRERARIEELVRARFGLSAEEAAGLMARAETATAGASHHYDYVRAIVDHCPPEERTWIIELMWEVAYADGELHELEANLLRRIGGLLYVSDRDRGAARKRVLKRMGLPEDAGL
jgi:uncharacterized tellurite resistance protein B-like protein